MCFLFSLFNHLVILQTNFFLKKSLLLTCIIYCILTKKRVTPHASTRNKLSTLSSSILRIGPLVSWNLGRFCPFYVLISLNLKIFKNCLEKSFLLFPQLSLNSPGEGVSLMTLPRSGWGALGGEGAKTMSNRQVMTFQKQYTPKRKALVCSISSRPKQSSQIHIASWSCISDRAVILETKDHSQYR